jgi:hypothetical protein
MQRLRRPEWSGVKIGAKTVKNAVKIGAMTGRNAEKIARKGAKSAVTIGVASILATLLATSRSPTTEQLKSRHVRLGSKADICSAKRHVHFAPIADVRLSLHL